jgi:hypothetical protein
VVSEPVACGGPLPDCKVDAGHGRTGRRLLCPKNEDEVRKLQPRRQDHPPKHRTGEEAEGVPGICRGTRDGALAGAHTQRPLHRADGWIHAQLAATP